MRVPENDNSGVSGIRRQIFDGARIERGSEEQQAYLTGICDAPAELVVLAAEPLLGAPDPLLRAAAVLALWQCVPVDSDGRRSGELAERVRAALARLAVREAHPAVQWALADASSFLPGGEWAEAHGRWARSDDEDLREAVASALGSHIASDALELALLLSADSVTSVRDWAALALGRFAEDTQDTRVIARLRELVRDPSAEVVAEAARGLAACGDFAWARLAIDRFESMDGDAEDSLGIEHAKWMMKQARS